MGQEISSAWTRLFGRKTFKIAMIGLWSSGKTRIVHKLQDKSDDDWTWESTEKLKVETVDYKDVAFEIWDKVPCGHGNVFPFWRNMVADRRAIVFVVNSAERGPMMDFVVTEFKYFVKKHNWRGDEVFLIFANKQDLPGARTTDEIEDLLGLKSYSWLNWHVQASVATEGIGLREGFDWMYSELVKK